ncbi:hypothetical protein CsSME_00032740 [Camellia sinensis var. sinensis]
MVCQAVFNPQNALYVACPNDCRRFFPNPASEVDPLHLEYFSFSGRDVSLEDIHDADPCLYNSCKKILEMDAEMLDSDALVLTFVREELGSGEIVELCAGGKSISVNSRNREDYVDLLIRHHFVTSISEQVAHFAKGFSDMLCQPLLHKFFSLELEDLDRMLHGSESAVSVED